MKFKNYKRIKITKKILEDKQKELEKTKEDYKNLET